MRYQIVKYGLPETLRKELKAWQTEFDKYSGPEGIYYDGDYRKSTDEKTTEIKRFSLCCKTCGAELYGEYEFPNITYCTWLIFALERERTEKAKELAKNGWSVSHLMHSQFEDAEDRYEQDCKNIFKKPCPICGGRLSEGESFLNKDERFSYKVELGAALKSRDAEDEKLAQKAVTALGKNCDVYVPNTALNAALDSDALKKYILHIIHLENNIYSLKERLSTLYYRQLSIDRAVILSIHEPSFIVKLEIVKLRAAYQKAQEAAKKAKECPPVVSVSYPAKPSAPVLGTPGFLNKKKVLAENEALTARYQAALEAYHKEVRRCDEKKTRLIAQAHAEAQRKAEGTKRALETAERNADGKLKELEARPVPAKAIKEMLDKEIAEAEGLLKKTFAARNELYAYDIIFEKYRDVVALSSFYEYLMSGRCSALEGAGGAYNIYESEIRADRVISQLDTVIDYLEDIKQNQYMMYQEMRNINTSLEQLNQTMDKALTSIQKMETNVANISANTAVIAHNTAATAYYSKISAELTNALGYMVAFK